MSDRSRSSAEFSELTTLVTDGAGAIDSHVVDALVPAKEVLLHDGGELLERPVRLGLTRVDVTNRTWSIVPAEFSSGHTFHE